METRGRRKERRPVKPADVVVIGGGVVGLSVAYHLAIRGAGRVALIERSPFLGTGSTGKCAGGIRQQFSSAANVRVSIESVRFLEHFEEITGAPLDFQQNGYLFLLATSAHLAHFQANMEMQRSMGLDVRLLSSAETKEIVPVLNTDDLVGATFCPTDGLVSPNDMTMGFAGAARTHGVEILLETEATGIELESGRVKAVVTSKGRIETRAIVNAAGPHARPVAAWAGVELPVFPVRRHIFTTRPLPFVSVKFPMVVDFLSGVYMHQESGGMLLGLADKDEPYSFNEEVNWDFLERIIEPAVHRIPQLAQAEILTGWAGLYEDTPDHNAVLGPVPGVEGFFLANGFSGHGLMHAPAAGRIVADSVVRGFLEAGMETLGFERFARGDVRAEANVI